MPCGQHKHASNTRKGDVMWLMWLDGGFLKWSAPDVMPSENWHEAGWDKLRVMVALEPQWGRSEKRPQNWLGSLTQAIQAVTLSAKSIYKNQNGMTIVMWHSMYIQDFKIQNFRQVLSSLHPHSLLSVLLVGPGLYLCLMGWFLCSRSLCLSGPGCSLFSLCLSALCSRSLYCLLDLLLGSSSLVPLPSRWFQCNMWLVFYCSAPTQSIFFSPA